MSSFWRWMMCAAVLASAVSLPAQTIQEERLQNATRVLQEILDTPDSSIPRDLLDRAECIGIIPSVKKFAFGFGGRYGSGYVLCKKDFGKGAWGAPSAFRISGGSFGLQLGFSATDFVLLFMNRYGVEKLLQDRFTLGADATVAAGPVGRSAEAATNAQLVAQILSYSRSRGLFAGVALEGAVVRASRDDNRQLYGRDVSPKELLIDGTVAPPASAEPLIQMLATHSPPARTPAAGTAAAAGTGSITGVVRDTTGAAVAEAVITVTNAETHYSRWVTTNAEGRYTVPELTAGGYIVKAQATGMAPVTTSAIALASGASQVVDFRLEFLR